MKLFVVENLDIENVEDADSKGVQQEFMTLIGSLVIYPKTSWQHLDESVTENFTVH